VPAVGATLVVETRYYELCFIGYLNRYREEFGVKLTDYHYCFYNSLFLALMQTILVVLVLIEINEYPFFLSATPNV